MTPIPPCKVGKGDSKAILTGFLFLEKTSIFTELYFPKGLIFEKLAFELVER